MHPWYTPDRAVCRALAAIDPALSVDWVAPGRWAVFDGLQTAGNVEASARRLAGELYRDARDQGYLTSYWDCLKQAYRQVEEHQLVHLVAEPDGSYRPLDGRVVEKFRRMAWFRRNYTLRDWLGHARRDAETLRGTRERNTANAWDAIGRDRAFQRMGTDLIQGYHAPDSVSFPQEMVA